MSAQNLQIWSVNTLQSQMTVILKLTMKEEQSPSLHECKIQSKCRHLSSFYLKLRISKWTSIHVSITKMEFSCMHLLCVNMLKNKVMLRETDNQNLSILMSGLLIYDIICVSKIWSSTSTLQLYHCTFYSKQCFKGKATYLFNRLFT